MDIPAGGFILYTYFVDEQHDIGYRIKLSPHCESNPATTK